MLHFYHELLKKKRLQMAITESEYLSSMWRLGTFNVNNLPTISIDNFNMQL